MVPVQLDSGGNFLDAQAQLRRFLAKESGAMALVATLDDTTALAAKLAAETAGRVPDTVIVSQGCDRSVHGGASANKVIDPNNRNSIVLGSVAYFLDRYGSEILPLALKMLRGEHGAATLVHRPRPGDGKERVSNLPPDRHQLTRRSFHRGFVGARP